MAGLRSSRGGRTRDDRWTVTASTGASGAATGIGPGRLDQFVHTGWLGTVPTKILGQGLIFGSQLTYECTRSVAVVLYIRLVSMSIKFHFPPKTTLGTIMGTSSMYLRYAGSLPYFANASVVAFVTTPKACPANKEHMNSGERSASPIR
jgi:hypothetical protein